MPLTRTVPFSDISALNVGLVRMARNGFETSTVAVGFGVGMGCGTDVASVAAGDDATDDEATAGLASAGVCEAPGDPHAMTSRATTIPVTAVRIGDRRGGDISGSPMRPARCAPAIETRRVQARYRNEAGGGVDTAAARCPRPRLSSTVELDRHSWPDERTEVQRWRATRSARSRTTATAAIRGRLWRRSISNRPGGSVDGCSA